MVYINKSGTLNSISINDGVLKTTTIVNDKTKKVSKLFESNGYLLTEYQSKITLGIYSASNNKITIHSIDQNLIDRSNFDHFYTTKTKDGGADLYLIQKEYLYGIKVSSDGTIVETDGWNTNGDNKLEVLRVPTQMFSVNNSVFASYWCASKNLKLIWHN